MKEPLIFVTNDDGVGAKGFRSAISVARKFGRVVAVAPEIGQSGKSHAISMHDPLYLRRIADEPGLVIYGSSGTPVDCVKLAMDHLLKERRPDYAISGINHGSNSSIAVIYSGTMGAAVEASFYNIPSIGLSLLTHEPDADFEAAEYYSEKIVGSIITSGVAAPLCLNVNIPVAGMQEIRGIRVCRQNRSYFCEEFDRRIDPHGREYFWLTGDLVDLEPDADDTDEWSLRHNYISIVPVQADMTDYSHIASLKEIIEGAFSI